MSDTPTPGELRFDYIKGNHFRVVHADGVFGGVTHHGKVWATVWSERGAIPTQTVFTVTSRGFSKKTSNVAQSGTPPSEKLRSASLWTSGSRVRCGSGSTTRSQRLRSIRGRNPEAPRRLRGPSMTDTAATAALGLSLIYDTSVRLEQSATQTKAVIRQYDPGDSALAHVVDAYAAAVFISTAGNATSPGTYTPSIDAPVERLDGSRWPCSPYSDASIRAARTTRQPRRRLE